MDKLEDNCKSKLPFRVWARMVLMEVVGKDCFGRYLGVKASAFAAGLDARCGGKEGGKNN